MQFPSFENLAPNLNKVTIGNVSVWFSYDTPVAFKINNMLVCHENIWSKTTGKHLTMIDGGKKENRVKSNEFKELWDKEVGGIFTRAHDFYRVGPADLRA